MGDDHSKKMKVKKGYLAVSVGINNGDVESSGSTAGKFQRFVIPISYLYHPHFKRLLEQSQEVYGFKCSGPLKLHCSVDDFHRLQRLIGRDSRNPLQSCRATNSSKSFNGVPWP